MGSNVILFIIFMLVCITILVMIRIYAAKSSEKPRKKTTAKTQPKTPVHIPLMSEEGLDFMKVYDLTWKPSRERPAEFSPEIQKIVNETESISSLVSELTNRLNDPEISAQDIGKLIATDQGLTSFILRRVNSPYYGLIQKCDNIFNAIVILGYNEIHRIVMEERIRKMGVKPSKQEWIHANLTSHIAAYLAMTSRVRMPVGTLVTLGILHDIAKDIMAQKLPRAETDPPTDPRQRLKWEIEYYGIDHATLGAALAKAWRIPERMCSCIEQHHWPMFWPFREVGKLSPNVVNEITFLSIADVAAKNFTQEIQGTYIGDDYYGYIRKAPKMERILAAELMPDLKRIARIGAEME
jgi:HD-like signal output (HDOD) protein